MRSTAAPGESSFIRLGCDPIQFDRLENSFDGDRDETILPGEAEHEHIAGDRVPEERGSEFGGF